MSQITYRIIEGSEEWTDKFAEFCRQQYQLAYPRPELGITEELFSREVFASPRIQQYFAEICAKSDSSKTWLAIDETGELVGVVAAGKNAGYVVMKSFYVRNDLKGQGIGHALYQKVLSYAADLPIHVDVVEYMTDTIKMYQHWGFRIDITKGYVTYDLIEWPTEAQKQYRGVYLIKD